MGEHTDHQEHTHTDNTHQEHHSSHQHSHSTGPFTDHQQILIAMAHKHQQFEAHHHHHSHHDHIQYRRPFALDTNLGLFALKKLNAINPELLRESQKRLLLPSAPGAITHIIYGALLVATSGFALSVWRREGSRGFVRPQVAVTCGALFGSIFTFQFVANYFREFTLAWPRRNMVNRYRDLYGEKYLLDVLDPNFRLPETTVEK